MGISADAGAPEGAVGLTAAERGSEAGGGAGFDSGGFVPGLDGGAGTGLFL